MMNNLMVGNLIITGTVQYGPAAAVGTANVVSHAVETMDARLIAKDTMQRRRSGNG